MDMRCVKCGQDRVVKNGRVQDIPKHQGNACRYQFTKNTVHDDQKYPLRIKLLAVWLSIRGVSMRRISRLGQGSTPSVRNGVRDEAREPYEKPAPAGQAVILEVYELGGTSPADAPGVVSGRGGAGVGTSLRARARTVARSVGARILPGWAAGWRGDERAPGLCRP